MTTRSRVGLDATGAKSYFAAISRQKGRAVLTAAGALAPGETPRGLEGAETTVALRASEAIVIALPGVAIEEAEEAFRWEVAKSGSLGADALRSVHRRGPGTDSGPPFLGVAAEASAAEMRATQARAIGLAPVAVTIESTAIECLLFAARKLPARGTVIHVDVRDGTSIVSAYGGAGLALRRTIRTTPVSADGLAIDIQRSASYGERKLSLPTAEAVYLSGDGVTPQLVHDVARGLPGISVEALDPFAAVDLGPKTDPDSLRRNGMGLVLPIGLALLESPSSDFIPPVEKAARSIRLWGSRARVAALVMVPLLLACGAGVRAWLGDAQAALERARARHARVELLQKRSEQLIALAEKTQAWSGALRQLGERDQHASTFVIELLKELPDEALLTELDLRGRYLGDPETKGRDGELDVRVRGELVTADDSAAVTAREALRKTAAGIAPGTQVVFEVAKRVNGQLRTGFSIDGAVKIETKRP